jgi:hypothetical protein
MYWPAEGYYELLHKDISMKPIIGFSRRTTSMKPIIASQEGLLQLCRLSASKNEVYYQLIKDYQ